jgi:hypothetical protein
VSLFAPNLADHARGISGHNRHWGNISADHTSRANNASRSDGDAGEDGDAGGDPHIVTDDDRFGLGTQVTTTGRFFMERGVHDEDVMSNSAAVSDFKMFCRVKDASKIDSGLFTDGKGRAALDVDDAGDRTPMKSCFGADFKGSSILNLKRSVQPDASPRFGVPQKNEGFQNPGEVVELSPKLAYPVQKTGRGCHRTLACWLNVSMSAATLPTIKPNNSL